MIASVGTPKHLRLFRTNRVALNTQTFFTRAKDSNRDAVTLNRALEYRQPPRTLGTPLALGMAWARSNTIRIIRYVGSKGPTCRMI
jgi:hypothetical protein